MITAPEQAWQEAHDAFCRNLTRAVEPCDDHMNPYAAPPEPPEGTVVVDRDGDAWQRIGDRWFLLRGSIACQWFALHAVVGPLRVAVPLTYAERQAIVRTLRNVSAHALADHIERGVADA